MIIYALLDPRNDAIRYVGITKQTLKERTRQHLKSARNGIRLPVCAWIRKLLSESLKPSVKILEDTDDMMREAFWIAHHGGTAKLLNVIDATENSPSKYAAVCLKISQSLKGKKLSPEHREKLRIAHLGHSPSEETRRKQSERMKDFTHSEETKQKMRKPKTEAHRLAAAAALKKCREDGTYNIATGDRNGLRKHPESVLRGSKNPFSKLNEDNVLKMRTLYSTGINTVQLAAMFGVSQCTSWNIVNRKTWRHV